MHYISNLITFLKVIFFITILIILGYIIVNIFTHTEQPKYYVIQSEDNIEIRRYSRYITAHTTLNGRYEKTLNLGFKTIAEYIFEGNKKNMPIAMTAPVLHKQIGSNKWQTYFFMPSQYKMSDLPEPFDKKKIQLSEFKDKKFIAIRFSGLNSKENHAKYRKILMQYIEDNNIQILPDLYYAFYNPPWTLPFLKRNEIWLELPL